VSPSSKNLFPGTGISLSESISWNFICGRPDVFEKEIRQAKKRSRDLGWVIAFGLGGQRLVLNAFNQELSTPKFLTEIYWKTLKKA